MTMAEDNELTRSDILDADNFEEMIDDEDFVDEDDDDDMYFDDAIDTKPSIVRKNNNIASPSNSGNNPNTSKDCYEFQVINVEIFLHYFSLV